VKGLVVEGFSPRLFLDMKCNHLNCGPLRLFRLCERRFCEM